MNFKGKKVLVIGIARSGIAAIKSLAGRGAVVTACDIKDKGQLSSEIVDMLDQLGIEWCCGQYPPIDKDRFDIVVPSPGVPLDIEPLAQARSLGLPVMGEVELAYLVKSPDVNIYAITGTNGKTTTTSLLQFILAQDGRKSVAGGNIGIPLIGLTESMTEGDIAVEMSSFQLAATISFRPHIAGLLNITPDHLDWHKTLEAYIQAKARIFTNQTADDFIVLNYEDDNIRKMAEQCPSQVLFFSTERVLKQGAYIENGEITVLVKNRKINICRVEEIRLRGKHNLENVLCAAAMATAAGVSPGVICKSLAEFKGIRHRMEEVAVKQGVLYVNDSKGTNPESTIKAIESFEEPIVLILGGRNKGSDFRHLARLVSNRVKAVVVLGEARMVIKQAVMETGFKNINEVEDFAGAVSKAAELADPGDVVLLSPACASWDMFDNYEQRGDLFCRLVNEMK